MNGTPSYRSPIDAILASREPGDSTRLWPALSRPVRRSLPPKGLDGIYARVFGVAARRRAGRSLRARAARIIDAASSLNGLTERDLDARIDAIRARVRLSRDEPATVDVAFAVGYEVVRRQLGLSLYQEQVMGALAMARGRCIEMATGEGKTVTAILPAAIDAWMGRGVHVLTVNDYLARRDAGITLPAYRRLGLRVAALQDEMKPPDRKNAYEHDITYAADKQVIFDYLRDRLHAPVQPRLSSLVLDEVTRASAGERWDGRVVQRGQYSAIVDEADSVLIDEAVTPAIIGLDAEGEGESANAEHFRVAAVIARDLDEGRDFSVDRRMRRVRLTDAGRDRLAAIAADLPAFWSGPNRREELMVQALSARSLYTRGEDYVVREGKVVIVDRSTGRILDGRQWQLGVHQAVEAKEGIELSSERRTTARISYQRFFQRYRRLSGMSGTVWEVADELWRDYALGVTRIPTHRPIQRRRRPDRVFGTEASKQRAVIARIAQLHEQGRPVLIGTRSVTSSESLGAALAERGIACRILNATREQEEADIVAGAGQRGAVTVSTNMAGRGTDIILDEFSRQSGGLVVISTERNDERRVDRQLYGRSGRQGDPGLAETFVSLEDRLIVTQGFRPLVALCRAAPGPMRTLVARVLWPTAQRSASRKAASLRAQAAQTDASMDVSMHHETR
ncbi:MAG: hypothetical protein ACF8SC_09750 [Phycisphaerales bacterium JB037]